MPKLLAIQLEKKEILKKVRTVSFSRDQQFAKPISKARSQQLKEYASSVSANKYTVYHAR